MATRSRGRTAKKGNIVRVDLSDVETRVNVSEGEHRVSIDGAPSQEDGDKYPYISWKFKCVDGDDSEGGVLYNNTSLAPQSLWNLRTLLEALGVEIPDSEMDIDLDEMDGLELMVSVEMETYEGKKRPRIVDFWAAEDEEKPKGKSRRGKKDADDEDDKPARGRRGAKKEEADEEDERPRGRSRAGSKGSSKKKAPTVTEDEINDMSEDELEDVIKDNDLDVDLSKSSSLRKMRAAVIDAAQEAGIIGDDPDEPDDEPEEKPARSRSRSRSRR